MRTRPCTTWWPERLKAGRSSSHNPSVVAFDLKASLFDITAALHAEVGTGQFLFVLRGPPVEQTARSVGHHHAQAHAAPAHFAFGDRAGGVGIAADHGA